MILWSHKVKQNTKERKSKMKQLTVKQLIEMINHEENFDKAQGMLEMFNAVYGTKYGLLNRRVVRFEHPEASTCIKCAHCYDVWVEL